MEKIEMLEISKRMEKPKLDWMIDWFKNKGFRVFLKPKAYGLYTLFRSVDNEDKVSDYSDEILIRNTELFQEV